MQFHLDYKRSNPENSCTPPFTLPHILQPRRVTENTATVIDNIFSNNIQDNIESGNTVKSR